LAEETGYRAQRMQHLAEFYTSPGILDERMFLFLASELAPGAMALEGGEIIEPRPTAPDEAKQMIRSGAIEDGKTLVGLLWYFTLLSRPPEPTPS
jgi:ADP-ribose pyrophosphatase